MVIGTGMGVGWGYDRNGMGLGWGWDGAGIGLGWGWDGRSVSHLELDAFLVEHGVDADVCLDHRVIAEE